MTVLLTGAAGLVGMAVRSALRAVDQAVVPIDVTDFGRDDPELVVMPLDDRPILESLIRARDIRAIIHCGAISGPMLAKGQPLALVAANIDATALLLELARLHAMRRFVFCSSISVYGDVGAAAIDETTPLRPTSVYGATKVACEQLIGGFAAEYGIDGVSLRIARIYGPYRRANCHLKALLEDVVADRETEIPCDPGFIYHYVYVDDVARAILACLQAPRLPHRDYNVGSGEASTMPQILAAATAAVPELRARLTPGEDDVPDRQTAFDIRRIAEDLGWQPNHDIGRGMLAYREALKHETQSASANGKT
jgi:UDP-glucuronate 4-epimerase